MSTAQPVELQCPGPVATDGEHIVRTPYDRMVLVMPSIAPPKLGTTMLRLGRFEG